MSVFCVANPMYAQLRLRNPCGSSPLSAFSRHSRHISNAKVARVRAQQQDIETHNTEQPSKPVGVKIEGGIDEIPQAMFQDFGFRSGHGRMYQGDEGRIPLGGLALGKESFVHEFEALRRSFVVDEWHDFEAHSSSKARPFLKAGRWVGGKVVKQVARADRALVKAGIFSELKAIGATDLTGHQHAITPADAESRAKLGNLVLDDRAIDRREKSREKSGLAIRIPWFVKAPYKVLCFLLDVFYHNRPIQRFWLLEMVARMPYFSYISMLHLYETLGWWRAGAQLRKVHFAEEFNELHHLEIMESLGGDHLWFDRFLAQHAAILYYWVLILFFFADPEHAYNFSELLEGHAVDTYGEFVDSNQELLQSMPPPIGALKYYKAHDMYMFDAFQVGGLKKSIRHPKCRNLHDVFENIRDDEADHVRTMHACQAGNIFEDKNT